MQCIGYTKAISLQSGRQNTLQQGTLIALPIQQNKKDNRHLDCTMANSNCNQSEAACG